MRGETLATFRHPRDLHPAAWWLWALGLAATASRTTNPLLLILIVAVAGLVVAARRTDAPWARAYPMYLKLGLLIIGIRLAFRMVLGASFGSHILFELPSLTLPDWAAGVTLGGPVTVESIAAAVYDGLRLAVLLACLGAANALANPKRLLRSVPSALHDVGAALVVAVALGPQVIESLQRVRRARVLRGDSRGGLRRVNRILVPVLEDALGRSMTLAAAMDSRGYGSVRSISGERARLTRWAMLAGLGGTTIGLYGVLDGTTPPMLGVPFLVAGVMVSMLGLRMAGGGVEASRYRPDRWRMPEWVVAGSGLLALACVVGAGALQPSAMYPTVDPLAWPEFSWLATVGIMGAGCPAWLSPPHRPEMRAPHVAVAEMVELGR